VGLIGRQLNSVLRASWSVRLVRLWLISAVISLSVRVHSNAAGAPLQRRTGRHQRFSGENIGAVQGAGATGARRRANTVWKLAKQLKPI